MPGSNSGSSQFNPSLYIVARHRLHPDPGEKCARPCSGFFSRLHRLLPFQGKWCQSTFNAYISNKCALTLFALCSSERLPVKWMPGHVSRKSGRVRFITVNQHVRVTACSSRSSGLPFPGCRAAIAGLVDGQVFPG